MTVTWNCLEVAVLYPASPAWEAVMVAVPPPTSLRRAPAPVTWTTLELLLA